MGLPLFIVYLNDSEKGLKASTKAGMYADDTQVSLVSSNVNELVRKAQDELGNILEFLAQIFIIMSIFHIPASESFCALHSFRMKSRIN